MANASKKHGMGAGTVVGHQTVGQAGPDIVDEDDLAGHIAKADRLNSHDRPRFNNERKTLPGSQDLRNKAHDPSYDAQADGAADRDTVAERG